MNLIKKRIKIGDLYEKYGTSNKIDEIINIKKHVFIKSESGELVQLNGVIKKSKCKIIELKFENNIILRCSDKHLLKIKSGEFKFVRDININDYAKTKDSVIKLLLKTEINYDYVYDVSMKKEFVYTTPNGLIHHNSMLAMQAAGNAQKVFKNPIVSFLDSEEATTSVRLRNLGVDNPPIKPIGDLTIEKVFKFLETLCLFKEQKKIIDIPSVAIWDSIANTLTQKEREAEDPKNVIGYKAKVLAMLVPKYVAKCAQYNICWIAVNQLRDVLDMGMFAAPKDLKFISHGKDMPGGTVLKYNAFHLVEMKVKGITDPAKHGFDGIICRVKCVKNKLFPPNVEIELVGNFLTGFDNFWTNYNFLTIHKRMKTGAWNYLTTYPEKKFRTKDAKLLYETEKEFKDKFDEAVKDTIRVEIKEKYDIIT